VLAELRRRDPRWRLGVCGSGTMEAALAERVGELGLADHAELRGYVPVETGLAELYRSSHAFLHVSWTEGFPQVLVEAFAAGLPTVATAVGGIDGWARDAALLVGPGDAPGAADALQQLAADPQLRARLIGNGIELARRNTIAAQCRLVAAALEGGAAAV
jgi:glycosyltransferase involved in cell wall biosynthesis